MKPIVAGLFLTLVLVAGGRAWLSRSNEALPSLPAQPARVPVRLLQAQPFFLDEGWIHEWRAERPVVDAGYLLVIQTDPELLVRRQGYEPVLYVGDQTAERLHNGEVTGRLVVVVPAARRGPGQLEWDWDDKPIWFGEPGLPERVDEARILEERVRAEASGVQPASPEALALALGAGGEALFLPDRLELDAVAADWIELHSPLEVDLIETLRWR